MWRYVSVRDLALLVRAVTLSVILFLPLAFALTRLEGMPRSVPVILWFVTLTFVGGPRLFLRFVKEGRIDRFWLQQRQPRVNVLVAGAGDEAELFIRTALHDRQSPYHIVGVLDEKETRIGREIHNVSILGSMKDLRKVVKNLKRKGQLPQRLALSKTAGRIAGFDAFLSEAQALGLSLSSLPSATHLQGTSQQNDIRPIALEDLLGRPETVLDREAIISLVAGKRVLVTGSGGTIGSEICRQIAALKPAQLVLVENSEFNLYSIDMEIRETFPHVPVIALLGDVRESVRIRHIFETTRPSLVFHAAALKHVPMAETNMRETLLTNVLGTRNVADAARSVGADAMVLISTDKAVRPANVMGASKRMAEHYCQALDNQGGSKTRFLTVRFGNVLGSTGSVVPRFREQIAKGGPVTVTHPDITRYFMTVREAVELVLQASAHATSNSSGTLTTQGRIMVLDMGAPVKIVDLARQMIRLAGLRPDEDIKITYSGLRPGEKLYEELFSESEQLAPAGKDGVLLAAAVPQPLAEVADALDLLVDDLKNARVDDDSLRYKIQALVPEYTGAEALPERKQLHG
jgi:FlaA1/EpsC-like NDP-sugar epimerase